MISSLRLWSLRLMTAALVFGALLGAQSLIESTLNPYAAIIIVLAGVNIILVVSLNLINGITGQFSLGHAGFMAIGAYSAAAFSVFAGPRFEFLPEGWMRDATTFLCAILIAAVAAGIAGFLVGLPSLRLRGDYLAIVTLGFGQIIVTVIRNMEVIGGASGFKGVPLFTNFVWVGTGVILCILCVRNLAMSNLGRAMKAVREDEVAAEAAGVDTTRVKVLAFVISAMWAGIAGALQVHYTQLAHPNDFTFMKSIEVVVMVVLGGLGSITGAALSAVLLRVLEEYLRDVNWAFGSGIALVILAAILSYPKYQLKLRDASTRMTAIFTWLRWPVVSLVGLALLYQFGSGWMAANVSALRYVIYALILIVLMLLRPQGLLGRGEWGWHLLRRRGRNKSETDRRSKPETPEEGVAGTM
jgi:branched-chain amino acid transport system permease protein